MPLEEQQSSQLGPVALDNLQWYEGKQRWDEVKSIDQEFTALLGPQWKESAKDKHESILPKQREPVT
ncbi:hypothetical protein [Paraflavitalea speifideaquila]|uniref:hypothetical protein n=1 Tax=Paraflavitalea speifideaquila TaxID=3076558 RepID=UPI0028F13365|nr:hypothetical protein [Paraflavitalea speifideiaquila]